VVVAESGLETQEQLGRVRSFADAVLIGSRLMAAPDPGAAIRDLGFPRRAPRVKICGLRDRAAAERCAALGVDRVGFNFVAGSKRQVRPEQAKVIWSGLEGPQPVMVVAGASMEEIAALRRSTGFFAVQLHGDEPPDRCAQLAAEGPVIKALTADHDPASVRRYREAGAEILFDAPKGGGGVPFDWGRLAGRTGADFTLAGGLTAENVAAAIGALDPPAVDVASGVERDGAIDPDRIAAFVAAVRGTAEAP
jgi:phosphoribosylanthranilate isomerase